MIYLLIFACKQFVHIFLFLHSRSNTMCLSKFLHINVLIMPLIMPLTLHFQIYICIFPLLSRHVLCLSWGGTPDFKRWGWSKNFFEFEINFWFWILWVFKTIWRFMVMPTYDNLTWYDEETNTNVQFLMFSF